nr:unnamed protein product [Digitaria exilis]
MEAVVCAGHGLPAIEAGCFSLFVDAKTRHWIAKKIQCLKVHVIEASNRRQRYKVEDAYPRQSRILIDPRLPGFYTETTRLVGIDGPRNKVIKLLAEGCGTMAQLNVVSIVGFGGLGKTSLANEVYRKLEGQFDYRAFVLLATKARTKEEWEKIWKSIGVVIEKDTDMEEMNKILSLGYNDLYLSVFPEDYEIKRDRLIRRWIAEGFITTEGGQDMEEIGECYFNDLVNRSMIQPVGIQYDGRAEACRVHDMILDLITSKSCLSSLKHLEVEIVCHGARLEEVEAIEEAVKKAASYLSDELSLEMRRWDEEEILKDGEHILAEEEFDTYHLKHDLMMLRDTSGSGRCSVAIEETEA